MSSNSAVSLKRTRDAVSAFHGEEPCFKDGCRNSAYYSIDAGRRLSCGVHSRRSGGRCELPVNPNAEQHRRDLLAERERRVLEVQSENKAAGRRGTLTVSRLLMMRAPQHTDGVRNVFPNNRHQNRVDGFGCAALSPMRLGPVRHHQPGLPDSVTIENYHQFNKVFPSEVEDATAPMVGCVVKPEFFAARDAAYRSAVPRRHKPTATSTGTKNKNVPLFSIHLAPTGEERRYTYVQSRYFYCHQYELLAERTDELRTLRRWLADGMNLAIVGYDGHADVSLESLWYLYNSDARPFGHEIVLFAMLACESTDDYPWNRYYRENRALYD